MPEAIEPPAQDSRWDSPVEPVAGDWDRDFWVRLARDVYGIDADVLDDRSTEWVVGRVNEERRRCYDA